MDIAKHLLFLALLLIAAPALAAFCGPDLLYMHDQADPWNCSAELAPGGSVVLVPMLEVYNHPGPLGEVQFRFDNWLAVDDPGEGQIVANWTADEVLGDLATGITLRWNDGLEPISGGMPQRFEFGSITVTSLSPDWVAADHVVSLRDITYTDTASHQYVGEDEDYWHGLFTFNPSDWSDCLTGFWDPPANGWTAWRYVSPAAGAIVPPMFTFTGEAHHWDCWYGYAWGIEVQISLNGEPIGEFVGSGLLEIEQAVDARDMLGETITIGVDVIFGDFEPEHFDYVYTVDDDTGAKAMSLSTIKSLY